jgi:hypothetical protein
MSNAIERLLHGMKWSDGGGLVSWEEMEDYWKDDKAWKSDALSIEQCIKDVRFLITNFKLMKEAAVQFEDNADESNKRLQELKSKLDEMGIVTYEGTTWQDRVWFEKDATKKRIEMLEEFMKSPGLLTLSRHMECLMYAQAEAMRVYVALLEARLARGSLEGQLADMPAG